MVVQNAKFAVDTSAVEVVRSPAAKDVQKACQKILSWAGSVQLHFKFTLVASSNFFPLCSDCLCSSGFPGAQPVSMDLQNIRFINEKPYRVSWKADGTR